jgi:type II secretory pathway component HofQ
VFKLQAVLTSSDYRLDSAADGYLMVLPKPADLAVDNQADARTVLAVEIDPQLRALALQEQQRQQTEQLAHSGALPPRAAALAPRPALPDPEDLRRLMQQIAQDRLGDSAAVLNGLRGQPVLQWSATQVPRLLNVMETHE